MVIVIVLRIIFGEIRFSLEDMIDKFINGIMFCVVLGMIYESYIFYFEFVY